MQDTLRRVTLELTNKCQLDCGHCYAESGPLGTHGEMTSGDWTRIIDDAAKQGVEGIQLIGGEPTLHPDFIAIANHALAFGLVVEVFTNLVKVTPALWQVFKRSDVSVTTSYYSDDPEEHARITGGANSHRLTTMHIGMAVQQGVSLRAAVIRVLEQQRVEGAMAVLRRIGVTQIDLEDVRRVGRAADGGEDPLSALCGGCTGTMAISPNGVVTPCVFARSMPVGNARISGVGEVLTGAPMRRTRNRLEGYFQQNDVRSGSPCLPDCVPAPIRQDSTSVLVSTS